MFERLPAAINVDKESLDQQISSARHRVDIARNNLYILQRKVQRRLDILSERLFKIETAIEETSNPDATLFAAKDRIESLTEKIQLTWGQRLNMAESGVEYQIMAMEKLIRDKEALRTRKATANAIEMPGLKASANGGPMEPWAIMNRHRP